MSRRGKKGKKGRGKRRRTLAAKADRHALYQQAVQAPEGDSELFCRLFEELRGRVPGSLREDFCGTAYLSCYWAGSAPERTAVAVDLDPAPLDWGRRHNLEPLGDAGRRVRLIEADVRDGRGPKTDLACALNFSFCALKTRAELGAYLAAARKRLVADGLLFLELYGGTEAIVPIEEERELDGCRYVWEQERFNPIDHYTICHIHFDFPDGSRLERAFTYDWRLWTIPEVRELLAEAGFEDSRVYWEAVDDEGDGTGEYRRTEEEENQEGWLVYVVGLR